MFKDFFTAHLQSNNENYFKHMKFALLFAASMLIGGFACLLHAFFPFLLPKTGSNFMLKALRLYLVRTPQGEAHLMKLMQVAEQNRFE